MSKEVKKLGIQKDYLKKKELLSKIAEETSLTAKNVEGVFEATSNIIFEELTAHRKVVIPGIGTFKPAYRPESLRENAVNPRTGQQETRVIAEKYKVNFSVEKGFGERFHESMSKAKAINKKVK